MFLSEVASHHFALVAGPSSVKNRRSIIEVFSEKDVLKILILVLENDNERTLA